MLGIHLTPPCDGSPMPEAPLIRQWLLLRRLSGQRYGMTLEEMADEAGVSSRTIRRDLRAFERAGFPLVERVEEQGLKRWRLDGQSKLPELTFTFDQAASLYLGRHLMEPLAGTLFWSSSQQAFQKIRAMLGTDVLAYLDTFRAAFHQTAVGTSDYTKKADLIDQLMVGIEDQKAVFITYRSLRATEPVTYDVHPYGLAFHRGSLYLVGWAPEHDKIRHLKVDRLSDAEATLVPFHRPEDFDLQEHLAASFGIYRGDGEVRVKVRFSSTVSRYVEESNWHPSQKLTSEPDGSLTATFRLDGTREIKAWILGFGRHAEVLEPEELREEMREELAMAAAQYGQASCQTLKAPRSDQGLPIHSSNT